MKEVIVIGGPNGSGKTAFAREFLKDLKYPFLNSDEIASQIARESANAGLQVSAGRVFLSGLDEMLKNNTSFILESTLSGLTLQSYLKQLRRCGYGISLFYIYLENTEQNLQRIQQRVLKGGHNVPREDVLRRFYRSLDNFWNCYRHLVDSWTLVNNSGNKPHIIAISNSGELEIFHSELFTTFVSKMQSHGESQ